MLAALHVDDLVNRGAKSSDLHRHIVTLDCNIAGVGDHEDDTSDDKDYHPDTSGHVPPPPSRLPKQKKIKPRIVLDCTFMTFLCSLTFDNQMFWKGQQPLYSDNEMVAFNDKFCKQVQFLTFPLPKSHRNRWNRVMLLRQVD